MATTDVSRTCLAAQDWFGVAVRCCGLLCFYHAMTYFLYFVDMRLGLSDAVESRVPTGYLTYVVAYIVTGVFLLRSADYIVRFAYGHDDAIEPTTDETNA